MCGDIESEGIYHEEINQAEIEKINYGGGTVREKRCMELSWIQR